MRDLMNKVTLMESVAETQNNQNYTDAEFNEFMSAYVTALLWSSSNPRAEDDPENEEEYLNDSEYDLAPETENEFKEDCIEYLKSAAPIINAARDKYVYSYSQAGHDFALDRNHHGAGAWDRDIAEYGKQLTKLAQNMGEVSLFVNDDDLIYQD